MDLFQLTLLIVLSVIIVSPVTGSRAALLAYILVVQVDLSGGSFESAASIGFGNAWKAIALPTALLARSGLGMRRQVIKTSAFKVWLLFCAVVALGTISSPFPISAIKQLGYLYSYTALFLFLLARWTDDEVGTYRVVVSAMIITMIAAMLKSVILGQSAWGDRMTFLANPQSFTLYLVISLAVVVGQRSKRSLSNLATFFILGATPVLVVLSGGRTGFLALTIVVVAMILAWPLARPSWSRIGLSLTAGLLLIVFSLIAVATFRAEARRFVTETRALQLVGVVSNQISFEEVSTGMWRFGMYEQMIVRIANSSIGDKLVGRGTSSTAEIITKKIYWYRDYDQRTVDANRVAHNELLRSLYEWGVIGLFLFVSLIAITIRSAVRVNRRLGDYESYVLLAALIPILLFLVFENLLAMSATPSGVAISVLLSRISELRLTNRCTR